MRPDSVNACLFRTLLDNVVNSLATQGFDHDGAGFGDGIEQTAGLYASHKQPLTNNLSALGIQMNLALFIAFPRLNSELSGSGIVIIDMDSYHF